VTKVSQIDKIIGHIPFLRRLLAYSVARVLTRPPRQKYSATPSSLGLNFESIEVTTEDNLKIRAWEIPANNPKGLVVINHPTLSTRFGSTQGLDGIKIQFLPTLRHLNTAGYTIITYDQRGHGESEGGVGRQQKGPKSPVALGSIEWLDLQAVLNYVTNKSKFKNLNIGLVTHCQGANASLEAWRLHPEIFDLNRIKCQVLVQPTIAHNVARRLTRRKLKTNIADAVEKELKKDGSYFVDARLGSSKLAVPALFVQVRDDVYSVEKSTNKNDIEEIFDLCPTEKHLIWVGSNEPTPYGVGKRFDGHNYFNKYPEELIEFLNKHTAA